MYGKIGRNARSAQWQNFLDPGILHLGKIGYRLTHHSPTFAGIGLRWSAFQFFERMELFTLQPLRTRQYFFSYNPAHSRITPKDHLKQIVRLASRLPSWQAFLSFLRCWKNSFQKTGTFFGVFGSRNIRKQIIFSLTIPPPSWKIQVQS